MTRKQSKWYIMVGKDDSQIAYKTGNDTVQQVVDRYRDYINIKEIWFYGTNGKVEKIYKFN